MSALVTSMLPRSASLSDELSEVAARVRASVVSVRDGRRGAGAGVVLSAHGLVATNDHVARHEQAEVVLPGGDLTAARVVARDRANDLVVLRVDRSDLPAIDIADAREPRVGQLVLAVGHPFGVEDALSVGIVSGLAGTADHREMIRADILLNPGNSGGPLTDVEGRLIGINAMVAPPGIGLAVPSHLVRALVARTTGPAPYLGIEARVLPLSGRYRRQAGVAAAAGLIVTAVRDGSPAERAGLLLGDVIIGVAGRPVRTPAVIQDEALLAGPGGDLNLTIVRAGQVREITSRLEQVAA